MRLQRITEPVQRAVTPKWVYKDYVDLKELGAKELEFQYAFQRYWAKVSSIYMVFNLTQRTTVSTA